MHNPNMPAGPATRYQYQQSPQKSVSYPKGEGFAAGIKSDDDVLDKLKILREEYAREGEGDPQFFAQLDDLENHLLRKANGEENQNNFSLQQPQAITEIHHEVPPFVAPPFLGPGMLPPPMGGFQPPMNFYP